MEDSAQSRPDRRHVRVSTREELTNLPNLLTMMRVVLIAPVILLMLREDPRSCFYATLLFSVAAITDWLAGNR